MIAANARPRLQPQLNQLGPAPSRGLIAAIPIRRPARTVLQERAAAIVTQHSAEPTARSAAFNDVQASNGGAQPLGLVSPHDALGGHATHLLR